jgi:hypothetical protein
VCAGVPDPSCEPGPVLADGAALGDAAGEAAKTLAAPPSSSAPLSTAPAISASGLERRGVGARSGASASVCTGSI